MVLRFGVTIIFGGRHADCYSYSRHSHTPHGRPNFAQAVRDRIALLYVPRRYRWANRQAPRHGMRMKANGANPIVMASPGLDCKGRKKLAIPTNIIGTAHTISCLP